MNLRLLIDRQKSGMALVVTLAVVALMLIVTLAFFSQVLLERAIGDSSTANAQVDMLARSANEIIVADLIQEIAAGSTADPEPTLKQKLFLPRTISTTNQLLGLTNVLSTAPSMALQKVIATGPGSPTNLVKQSLSGRPFFQFTTGYTNRSGVGEPQIRASSANSGTKPSRGRAVSINRWLMPKLVATNEILQSPDWIYLDRSGKNPTSFTPDMGRKNLDNTAYIIGRYAYNLYDVGGLIDINVVGNALNATNNAQRGRLHQVSLANAPAPLTLTNFSQFVNWRSGASAADGSTNGGLADPKKDFRAVPAGSQAFVGRQELLRYVAQNGTIPEMALPYLTTFSRELNSPSYAPDRNRPLLPVSPEPEKLNPAIPEVRFPSATVLTRGSDPDVKVPAGSPVMARRFPLSKLSLLSETSPDEATLSYYFGLKRLSEGVYEYIATSSDGRIKRLSEVAAEGREPNFFEVLQAVIVTGSLGRNAGNTLTLDDPRDSLRNLQVIQIGANIIDQWDGNDLPTTIRFPSGTPGTFLDSHGVENLPYLNNISLIAHRPVYNRDLFQIWALFDVWNPHQNATAPPAGLEFRIQPRGGRCRVSLSYVVTSRSPASNDRANLLKNLRNSPVGQFKDILALNANRELIFNSANYSEPTIVGGGGPPTAETSTTGLLLYDFEVPIPPAIPAKSARSATLQKTLNDLMFIDYAYKATPDTYTHDPTTGNRIYPPNTDISGVDEKVWDQSTNSSGQVVIYAKYGVKAHNQFTITTDAPGNKIQFDLQLRVPGKDWKTYQTVNGFTPHSTDSTNPSYQGDGDKTNTVTQSSEDGPSNDYFTDTHHSVLPANDAGLKSRFYGWREPLSQLSMVKFDPRTTRFGHSGAIGVSGLDLLGTTIRQSATLPTSWPSGTRDIENLGNRWRVLRGSVVAGTQTGLGDLGFEWIGPGNSTDTYRIPYGLIANIPEGSVNTISNPSRYKDIDGVIRPADGYLGTVPTVQNRLEDRPRILNRPFHSVGEMGHVFRDLPWKTLDFSTRNSGDLGLLDAFSIDETEDTVPLVAGRVNLNSAPTPVLAALLSGSAKTETASSLISDTEAMNIATAITKARQEGPFLNRGDLVGRVLTPLASTNTGTITGIRKTEREAAIRTLGEIGSTRTWNLLLDLMVQGGHFSPVSKNADEFFVEAERRYWIHLAIDRFTGEVLEREWEVVNE